MKKLLPLLLIASSVLTVRADITTGLVGYWSLNDGAGSSNVVDSSGNGGTGSLVNFTDTTFNNMWTTNADPTNGWPNALQFNQTGQGTNAYVSIPDSVPLGQKTTNIWTLSAWVYPTSTSQPQGAGIIAKGVFAGTTYSYCLYVQGGKFFAAGIRNAGNTGGFIASNSVAFTANTWYHVCVTAHEPKTGNGELQLYVNGQLVYGTNANTFTTSFFSTNPVTIGCFGIGTLPFQGVIDEARIYDRALSASDVTQLFTNRAFALQNNGIGSWNGLAGSGGNATLDTTSLNYCTNLYTAPVGIADSLADVLNIETAGSLTLGASFADTYYSSRAKVPVTSTNLTITAGGVAMGTSSGAGSMTFMNSLLTYSLKSSDGIGLKDGSGGSTSLVQNGAGLLVVTGTNTFSGGATINAGTIQIGNGGAISGQELGTFSTVNDNGTLAFDGNNTLNYANTITGAGGVTQMGTGTLTLSGNNTYTNTTAINNATLSVSSMADGGTSSIGAGPVNLNSATLLYTGTGDTTARQFNGTSGTVNIIDIPSGITETLNGRVTGTAAWVVNKNNTGTLILGGTSQDNSFLGMNVNAGTLVLNKTGGTGHAIGNPLNVASGATVQMGITSYPNEIFSNTSTPVTINSGGVFDMNSQSDAFYTLSLAGTGIGGTGALINSAASSSSTLTLFGITLATNTTIGGSGSLVLSAPISGGGSLTYSGTGTAQLTLASNDTYSGGTFVTSGTLDANGAGSLPGNVTASGTGVLELDNSSAMAPGATLTLPASPAASSVNLNFSGAQNIGVLIIGGVRQPAGIYGSSASNPNNVFTGGGLLNVFEYFWDANGTDATGATNINGGGNGSWDNAASDWWLSGNSDTMWVSGNNAFFAGAPGVVTLNASETVASLFFMTNGYLITNTDGVSALTLAGNNPIIAVPSGTTTISAMLTGGGSSQGLTVSGPGTLALTGNNSYTGGTLIQSNATLSVNTISDSATSAIGTSGNLTFAGGGLAYTGPSTGTTTRTFAGVIATTNTIDVAPGVTLALSNSVTGATATVFNKTDSGTLMLGGTTDNSGLDINILAGEVIVTKVSTSTVHGLGGGTSTVGNGAELQLAGTGGFDLFTGCLLTVSNGGVLDLNGQVDSMSTLNLSGAGSGGGALINSATGTTAALTNAGSGVVLSNNTTVGGPGIIQLASTVSGNGSLTYAGTGTLELFGNNTYGNGTVINSGGTVMVTNSANAGGAGNIAVNSGGTLDIAIVDNNVILPNAITGPGIINIIETASNNLQVGGSMSGFTGTINCLPSPGGAAKFQILTTNVSLSSSAIINIETNSTLYVAGTNVVIPGPINIFGLGNAEVFGALRLESNAIVSGPVTLFGNTTMANGHPAGGVATISGPITQSGGTYGITFTAEPGTLVLSGTNTFAGPIAIAGGEAEIGGAGTLGAGNFAAGISNGAAFAYASTASQTLSGVMSGSAGLLIQQGPGTLTMTAANTFTGGILVTNNSTLAITGSGTLGATGTSNNYNGSLTNGGTFNYASSVPMTISSPISGTGVLQESGAGMLTLSAANTFGGSISVATGSTVVIASSGSINGAASVVLAPGATFDVSAFGLSYALSGGTALFASGTGTNSGTTAAAIKGGSSATVNIGQTVLGFKPTSFNGDTNHPALFVAQGSLQMSGSTLTVSNAAATPLGAGTYALVQVAAGSLSVASTNFTVTGTGLAANTTASLALSGSTLNLVVSASASSAPTISSVTRSGGNIIFGGTGGTPGGNYVVLASTNVDAPASQQPPWMPIATNMFTGTGAFSVTNATSGTQMFYIIEIPAH